MPTSPLEQTGLNAAAQASGLSINTDIYLLIGKLIRYGLGLVGAFFFILILIGGWQWMMSGGNEETVKKAKQRLITATVGLAIVMATVTITRFVIFKLTASTIWF
jgi:TRAP-type C4-dicarboxylate transport system permease small subunit